jgi:hypothetical protein
MIMLCTLMVSEPWKIGIYGKITIENSRKICKRKASFIFNRIWNAYAQIWSIKELNGKTGKECISKLEESLEYMYIRGLVPLGVRDFSTLDISSLQMYTRLSLMAFQRQLLTLLQVCKRYNNYYFIITNDDVLVNINGIQYEINHE